MDAGNAHGGTMDNQRALTLLLVLLLTGPMAARAVTLQIDGSGILTGASDVNVGGTLYDVQFLEGSCVSLFTGCDDAIDDFAFTTAEDALIAAQALLDQVFTDTSQGQFDSQPDLTNGCALPGFCSALTPYSISDDGVSLVFVDNFFSGDDQVIEVLGNPTTDTTQNGVLTFAVWSPASLPGPGTLELLGLGLVGLALTRRRRAD